MRKIVLLLVIFVAALVAPAWADQTNYICIVCGKGPLTGHIWLHPRGPICDNCEKILDRCSICGLPVLENDGHIKTGDGRLICKFDKGNVILTQDQARDLFEQTREDIVDLYGPQFALRNKEVTVNLFDVDYWSEKGHRGGLHKYGFSSSRPSGGGGWTHEVVMLSGRTREEMEAVAAHEYTHLWINENRPADRLIDGDTVEAICELTAYKYMQQKKLPERQKQIVENPYTNGKILDLISVEKEGGTDYVLNWVKTGKESMFDANANVDALAAPLPATTYVAGPAPLPKGLKFSGVMAIGKDRMAVINGKGLGVGDQTTIALHDGPVTVRCVEILDSEVKVKAGDEMLTLEQGREKMLP
jgi:hypothetical protein